MDLNRKIINDVKKIFDSDKNEIEYHFMKLLMWYSKCEVNLMELSHNNHNEFKNIIPEIVDVVISDFKKSYDLLPKPSERQERIILRIEKTFNKNMRFNELLSVSDFDLIMDALAKKYRKHINKFSTPKIKKSMSNFSDRQETILIDTRNIFEKKSDIDFIKKRKHFLKKVFPKIEELYSKSPSEFEKISAELNSIMYKQEVLQITSYLKNQDFKALQIYKNELAAILRPKYVSLENDGNITLYKFLTDYEKSIQNWMNGENGSKAILKDINKDNGHCYIATMVYGDYDHPNVLELRNYRDNSLKKTCLGKTFVNFYYKISPVLVQKIKHKKLLNQLIKSLLDKIVNKLKMKKKTSGKSCFDIARI